MKVKGRFQRRAINEDGSMEIVFKVDGAWDKHQIQQIECKDYELTVSEWIDARSLKQNKMMWEVIKQIADHTGIDDWAIYCDCLEKCGAKYEYIQAPTQAKAILEKSFRAIKKLNSFTNEKGNDITTFKCYYGSSMLNKKEMQSLLDKVLEIASEIGINAASYQEYI